LHFIDAARERGGHVLDSRPTRLRARLDPSNGLRVELPPGVDLGDPGLSAQTHAALARAEGG
jgi:alpha-acetolactate decarboxylase